MGPGPVGRACHSGGVGRRGLGGGDFEVVRDPRGAMRKVEDSGTLGVMDGVRARASAGAMGRGGGRAMGQGGSSTEGAGDAGAWVVTDGVTTERGELGVMTKRG